MNPARPIHTALLLLIAGCGGEPSAPPFGDDPQIDAGADDAASDAGDVGPPTFSIGGHVPTWSPCKLHEVGSASAKMAECADLELPLRHDGGGETMTVRAKRLRSTAPASSAHLWLVAGGPGSAGTVSHPPLMEALQQLYFPDVDFYTLDHRGTGHTERLGCPTFETEASASGNQVTDAEVPGCVGELEALYGARLDAYGATLSAVDLATFVEGSREPGKPVFVWGGSYGTYLVQRYLQIFPAQADGVILEAINSPQLSMVDFSIGFDLVGRKLFDETCAAHPVCAAKFAPQGPLQAYQELLVGWDAGATCPELASEMTSQEVKDLLARALQSNSTNYVVPPLVYRMRRCAAADVDAVRTFRQALDASAKSFYGEPLRWADALKFHVMYSEIFWNDTFQTDDDVLAYYAAQEGKWLFLSPLEQHHTNQQAWAPIAYHDAHFDNGWAETSVPMLMLQGALDPNTPQVRADLVGAHFQGVHQRYVLFPFAAHGSRSGDYERADGTRGSCAYEIWQSFLEDPEAPLDTSCVLKTDPPPFAQSGAAVVNLLGQSDLWENP